MSDVSQATSLKAEKISLDVALEQYTYISDGAKYSQVHGAISLGLGHGNCPDVLGMEKSRSKDKGKTSRIFILLERRSFFGGAQGKA